MINNFPLLKAATVVLAMILASNAAADDISIELLHQTVSPVVRDIRIRLNGSTGIVTADIFDLTKNEKTVKTECVLEKDALKAAQDNAISMLKRLSPTIQEGNEPSPVTVSPMTMITVRNGSEVLQSMRFSDDQNPNSQQASDFLKAWRKISHDLCDSMSHNIIINLDSYGFGAYRNSKRSSQGTRRDRPAVEAVE